MDIDQILLDQNYAEIERYLSRKGNPNSITDSYDNSLLHVLAFSGDPIFVQILLRYQPDINTLNTDHETPLIVSLKNEHFEPTETVKLLLNAGADPNIVDSDGNNALHIAVYYNHLNIVKLLLRYGMNLIIKNNNQQTARDIAFDDGNDEIVNLLDANKNSRRAPLGVHRKLPRRFQW